MGLRVGPGPAPRGDELPRVRLGGTSPCAGYGAAAVLTAKGPGRFADIERQAGRLLKGVDAPVRLLGGFSFAPDDASFMPPAWFILPRITLFEDGKVLEVHGDGPKAPLGVRTRGRRPGHGFDEVVAAALTEIQAKRLAKVVVARAIQADVDLEGAWERLAGHGTRYLVEPEAGTALVGASPETLVARSGRAVATHAVAGTFGGDAPGKLDAEHAFVATDIEARLRSFGLAVNRGARQELGHGGLRHHETPITAHGETPHILTLAAALHPTPAVAGTPREAALRFIEAHEAPRGWYSGMVGWFDAKGDGEFTVAIRGAQVHDGQASIMAGAGIVDGSDPAREYDETERKIALIKELLA